MNIPQTIVPRKNCARTKSKGTKFKGAKVLGKVLIYSGNEISVYKSSRERLSVTTVPERILIDESSADHINQI